MDYEQVTQLVFEHARKPSQIFALAIKTMGEDENFVKWRYCGLYSCTAFELDFPTLSQWYNLCNLLYLDLSCFQHGYCKELHQNRIWKAIKKGRYFFRITPQIKTIIEKMHQQEEANWKWQIDHTGDPLRSRLIKRWQSSRQSGYVGKRQPRVAAHIEKLYQIFSDENKTKKRPTRPLKGVPHHASNNKWNRYPGL